MRTFVENGSYIIETEEYKIVVKFKRYIGCNNALCTVTKIIFSTLPPDYLYEGCELTWNIRLLKLIARKKR